MYHSISTLKHTLCLVVLCTLILPVCHSFAEEVVIDFENEDVGKPLDRWTQNGVTIDLAHAPTKHKTKGRITFFPHIGTEHKGVLNAMADEAIPLRVTFEKPVSKAVLSLWGSTTSAAKVEAFDKDGMLLDTVEIDQVPVRKSPEEHIPFFQLSVEATNIAAIQISGAKPGGFLAVDELRYQLMQ